MTDTMRPTQTGSGPARTVELVLAHLHLRLGSLALARVELETLAGMGALDTIGLIDLAEVRWRTGDLLGAGEIAGAALGDGEADPVALIIASEAAAALGRPSESRRLAAIAIARAPDSIDAIFAGMPRSAVWPADGAEPAPSAPTLFERGPEDLPPPTAIAPATDEAAPGGLAAAVAPASMTFGFWDGDEVSDPESAPLPDPAREFAAGRKALVSGALEEAALRFGLALRLAPALALAVLEATEGARAPALAVVRGDAYRLAGHEIEARRAYTVAAGGGLPERRSKVRVRSKSRPAVVTDVEPPDRMDPAGEVDFAAEGGAAIEATAEADDQPPAQADEPPTRAGDDAPAA